MTTNNIPTLMAFPTDDPELWQVWCPHCSVWHYHGSKNGHRVPHCTPEGEKHYPYGYEVRLATVDPQCISWAFESFAGRMKKKREAEALEAL